jgi:hypothetical protein
MTFWTRQFEPIPREILPERLSEESYIALKKLEGDHLLGRTGLRGTLYGLLGALLTLLVIVFMPVYSSKFVVEGWQVVAMVAVFIIPVMFFGSFVFDRALKISAQIDETGAKFIGSTGGKAVASPAHLKPVNTPDRGDSVPPN